MPTKPDPTLETLKDPKKRATLKRRLHAIEVSLQILRGALRQVEIQIEVIQNNLPKGES